MSKKKSQARRPRRPIRQRNGHAKLLGHPLYRQRVKPSKKNYKRKKNNKLSTEDDISLEDEGELSLEGLVEQELANPMSNVRTLNLVKNTGNPDDVGSDISGSELVKMGLDAFIEEANTNTKGFIAILFDEHNNPRLQYCGEIDLVSALGSFKVAEHELLKMFMSDV